MFVEIATFRKPLLLLDYLDPIVIMVERPPARAGYFERVTAEKSRAFRQYRQENGRRCTRCNCCGGGVEGQEWPCLCPGAIPSFSLMLRVNPVTYLLQC